MASCCTDKVSIYKVPTGPIPDFWRSGVGGTDLPDDTADTTENIRRDGNVGINTDPVVALDVNGAMILQGLAVPNRPAGGLIGTAAATVDVTSTLVLHQTTANQVLLLPPPTDPTPGHILFVTHDGAVATTIGNAAISPGESVPFVWDGNSWNKTAGGGGGSTDDFWRSGTAAALLLPDGTTDYTDVISHNANVGVGLADPAQVSARLDVNGAEVLRTVALGNFAVNGAIGTAAATVDIASTITINQTTGNITLTIPNPLNLQQGRVLNISNIGTAQVKVGGQHITPKTGQSYVFHGAALGWIPLGDNPDVISVGASRNLAPTDHLKTILATAPITLTCPANIGYLLLRVRQNTAAAVITIAAAAGVTRVAPYGFASAGLQGASMIVEVFNNTVWVE